MALGIFAIWIGLGAILTALVSYWIAMLRSVRAETVARRAAVSGAAVSAAPRVGPGKKRRGGSAARGGRGDGAPADRAAGVLRVARWAFYVSCACVAIAAVTLEGLILSQRYEIFYIWKNSYAALPFFYRFASFWADQEGTFLLWGIYGSLFGLLFLRKSKGDERWVMPFLCAIQAYLFILLTAMSPFKLHPLEGDLLTAMQQQGIPIPHGAWEHFVYLLGFAPVLTIPAGHGLNESLQNPWMVIHPPTLFLGYSSMIITGAYAFGALMKRDYDSWVNRAAPWLMFSWMVLGTGIFLGAYWAYETLGWGGYWAWDPVENSSLMPWLVGTVLLHGLLAQRARGNFKHVNLLFGILAFWAVLYGSFLTRSGVLENMSVHSFASPGDIIKVTLGGVLMLWLLGGLALWIVRFRDIRSETAYDTVWERHFGFFLGLIVMAATWAIVAGCVSLPMLTKKSVPYTYYNRAILPIAFVMMLLMAITPLAPWRVVREKLQLRRLDRLALGAAAALIVAFILTGGYALMGSDKHHYGPALAVFAAAAALSLCTNAVMLWRTARGGISNAGPWISHIGFSGVIIGIVLTSYFSEQQPVTVAQGEQQPAFGWSFSYAGMYQPPKDSREHSALRILVSRNGGKPTELRTPLFKSTVGDGGTMGWPRMIHQWWGDLYVAPNGEDLGEMSLPELPKGQWSEELPVPLPDGRTDLLKFRFSRYVIDQSKLAAIREQGSVQPIKVAADVALDVNGKLYPHLQPSFMLVPGMGQSDFAAAPVDTPQGNHYELFLKDISANNGTATFSLATRNSAVFTVIRIPGIQILWGGVYVMLLGAFLSYRRRARLATRPVPSARAGRRSTAYATDEKGGAREAADRAANAPEAV